MAKVFKKDGAGRSYCGSCRGYVHPSKITEGGSTAYIKADLEGPMDPIIPYRRKGTTKFRCPECNGEVVDPYIDVKLKAMEEERKGHTKWAKRGFKLFCWGGALAFGGTSLPLLFGGFDTVTPVAVLAGGSLVLGSLMCFVGFIMWLGGKLGGG